MIDVPLSYDQPKVILGEGKADRAFFAELIKARGLTGFMADYPKIHGPNDGGWTLFGHYLKALEVNENFSANVKRVVVVGDHDNADSFSNICKQIKSAGYRTPTKLETFSHTPNKPDIAVLLIPDAAPGCLESICYQAGYAKWPALQAPLEHYIANSPVAAWGPVKQAKARLQCLITANCETKPDVAFHDHWQKPAAGHIPVTDPIFDRLAAFLAAI